MNIFDTLKEFFEKIFKVIEDIFKLFQPEEEAPEETPEENA